ncbi:1,6-anhydro-N-acetylmuramyl-L-alanine amidase AmpD [Aliikangiella sp. IMCC44653]
MKDQTIEDIWLEDAVPIISPHFNARPACTEINLLVIHCISLPPKVFGNHFVEDFFQGKLDTSLHPFFREIADLRVSAHFYIKRCGKLIQFVPTNQRAWHAGESEFNGLCNCNDFSIGVELEGSEDLPYTQVQYQTLASLTLKLQAFYPQITDANIVGHCDIAPQRKTDPGPSFDWSKYRLLLAK